MKKRLTSRSAPTSRNVTALDLPFDVPGYEQRPHKGERGVYYGDVHHDHRIVSSGENDHQRHHETVEGVEGDRPVRRFRPGDKSSEDRKGVEPHHHGSEKKKFRSHSANLLAQQAKSP